MVWHSLGKNTQTISAPRAVISLSVGLATKYTPNQRNTCNFHLTFKFKSAVRHFCYSKHFPQIHHYFVLIALSSVLCWSEHPFCTWPEPTVNPPLARTVSHLFKAVTTIPRYHPTQQHAQSRWLNQCWLGMDTTQLTSMLRGSNHK